MATLVMRVSPLKKKISLYPNHSRRERIQRFEFVLFRISVDLIPRSF